MLLETVTPPGPRGRTGCRWTRQGWIISLAASSLWLRRPNERVDDLPGAGVEHDEEVRPDEGGEPGPRARQRVCAQDPEVIRAFVAEDSPYLLNELSGPASESARAGTPGVIRGD